MAKVVIFLAIFFLAIFTVQARLGKRSASEALRFPPYTFDDPVDCTEKKRCGDTLTNWVAQVKAIKCPPSVRKECKRQFLKVIRI
uniref:Uncharacterized protein n=1 Tax=Panagrolaimus sp. ES5 TaxID=591445 RepID=A0AC34FI83_9BILA